MEMRIVSLYGCVKVLSRFQSFLKSARLFPKYKSDMNKCTACVSTATNSFSCSGSPLVKKTFLLKSKPATLNVIPLDCYWHSPDKLNFRDMHSYQKAVSFKTF